MPESITANEQELLATALASLGLKQPREKGKVEYEEGLTVVETKTIKGIVTCALCKTVTIQFIRFEKWSDSIWRMGKDYLEDECRGFECNPKLQVQKATVKSCWACEGVLLSKEKIELVKMIITLYAPVPSKKEIWKYIHELRMEGIKDSPKASRKRNKILFEDGQQDLIE